MVGIAAQRVVGDAEQRAGGTQPVEQAVGVDAPVEWYERGAAFGHALAGLHAAFPYLRDTAGAQVVNMCSASAIYGQPELATYSATKFALRALTEALDDARRLAASLPIH